MSSSGSSSSSDDDDIQVTKVVMTKRKGRKRKTINKTHKTQPKRRRGQTLPTHKERMAKKERTKFKPRQSTKPRKSSQHDEDSDKSDGSDTPVAEIVTEPSEDVKNFDNEFLEDCLSNEPWRTSNPNIVDLGIVKRKKQKPKLKKDAKTRQYLRQIVFYARKVAMDYIKDADYPVGYPGYVVIWPYDILMDSDRYAIRQFAGRKIYSPFNKARVPFFQLGYVEKTYLACHRTIV